MKTRILKIQTFLILFFLSGLLTVPTFALSWTVTYPSEYCAETIADNPFVMTFTASSNTNKPNVHVWVRGADCDTSWNPDGMTPRYLDGPENGTEWTLTINKPFEEFFNSNVNATKYTFAGTMGFNVYINSYDTNYSKEVKNTCPPEIIPNYISERMSTNDNGLKGKLMGTKLDIAANAFDSDGGSYYEDSKKSNITDPNSGWVGLDLGEKYVINRIVYNGEGSNLQLGVFEGANDPDFQDAVLLHMIEDTNSSGDKTITISKGFRYVRYVGPVTVTGQTGESGGTLNNKKCRISEIEFYGKAGEGDDSNYSSAVIGGIPTVILHTGMKSDGYNETMPYKDHYISGKATFVDEEGKIHIKQGFKTEIKGRGNGSWSFDKKPIRIKLDEHVDPLGKAGYKAKSWTLLSNHGDKSLMRNLVAFEVSRRMGLPYTPFGTPVNVFVDGEYKGCYQLCDQVEVRKGKFELNGMGVFDQGGENSAFLIEVDAYAYGNNRKQDGTFDNGNTYYSEEPYCFTTENYSLPVTFKYPSDDAKSPHDLNLRDYIKGKFDTMLENPNQSNLDYPSFFALFLTNELCGNSDAFWSTYFHKHAGDDKFYASPVWDFDIAFGNDYRPTQSDWVYLTGSSAGGENAGSTSLAGMKGFVRNMMDKPNAKDIRKQVWSRFRNNTSAADLENWIEDMAKKINDSQKLNFIRWNVMAQKVHDINPDASTFGGTFDGNVDYLKSYITNRYNWISSEKIKDYTAGSDMVISALTTTPGFAQNNREMTLKATIKNEGAIASNADITVAFYVNNTPVGTATYGNLAKGAEQELTCNWTCNTSDAFTLKAVITGGEKENVTYNNTKEIKVKAQPAPIQGAQDVSINWELPLETGSEKTRQVWVDETKDADLYYLEQGAITIKPLHFLSDVITVPSANDERKTYVKANYDVEVLNFPAEHGSYSISGSKNIKCTLTNVTSERDFSFNYVIKNTQTGAETEMKTVTIKLTGEEVVYTKKPKAQDLAVSMSWDYLDYVVNTDDYKAKKETAYMSGHEGEKDYELFYAEKNTITVKPLNLLRIVEDGFGDCNRDGSTIAVYNNSFDTSKGGIETSGSNNFKYTPAAGYVGTFRFQYVTKCSLSGIESDPATITITLTPETEDEPQEVIWVGGGDTDSWSDPTNWRLLPDGTTPEVAPSSASEIHLSANADVAPVLDSELSVDVARFHYGSQIGNIHNLKYNKAYIQYNFGKQESAASNSFKNADEYAAEPMKRDQYYAIAVPIKNVVSGDFAMGGQPQVFQRSFQSAQKAGQNYASGGWAVPSNATHWKIEDQHNAIAIKVANYTPNNAGGKSHSQLNNIDGVMEFPHFGTDDQGRPFHEFKNGNSYYSYFYYNANGIPVKRTDLAPQAVQRGTSDYELIFDGTTDYYLTVPTGEYVMVGNPFLSALNFAQFLSDNAGIVGNSYQLWENNKFDSYTGGNIAPLQAFFVKSTATSIKFTAAQSVVSDATLKSGVLDQDVLFISASNVYGNTRAQVSLAEGVDAENTSLLRSNDYLQVPAIYTIDQSGMKNTIQYEGGYKRTISFGVMSTSYEPITLTFDNLAGLDVSQITLIDKKENKEVNLLFNNTYSFNNDPAFSDRFEIQLAPNTVTGWNDVEGDASIWISAENQTISVNSTSADPIQSIELIDMQGRTIASISHVNESFATVNVSVSDSFVIVKVETLNAKKVQKQYVR